MNMNISITQISSRYHLKITEWFDIEEDNSQIVPKTPQTVFIREWPPWDAKRRIISDRIFF
jgi:hypothetical protein